MDFRRFRSCLEKGDAFKLLDKICPAQMWDRKHMHIAPHLIWKLFQTAANFILLSGQIDRASEMSLTALSVLGHYWIVLSFSLDHYYNDLACKSTFLLLSARLILYSKQLKYSLHISSVVHNRSFNSNLLLSCWGPAEMLLCIKSRCPISLSKPFEHLVK